MLQIGALLLILPFAALSDWFGFIGRQPPGVPQELVRASHGAAMIIFPLVLVFGFLGAHETRDFVRALMRNPGDPALWVPAAVWVWVVIWGFNWLIIGAGRSRAPFVDARLLSRAVVKTGLAVFLGLVVRNDWLNDWLPPDWQSPTTRALADLALKVVALWCLVTGVTKIWLLLRGMNRASRAPPPHPSPRGRAGDAREAEAYQALRRHGSRLDLDDKDF